MKYLKDHIDQPSLLPKEHRLHHKDISYRFLEKTLTHIERKNRQTIYTYEDKERGQSIYIYLYQMVSIHGQE